jgi:hypothetical protein
MRGDHHRRAEVNTKTVLTSTPPMPATKKKKIKT